MHDDYGEVVSNFRVTNVFVNAIAYKRFLDVYPDGKPIDLDVFRYTLTIQGNFK